LGLTDRISRSAVSTASRGGLSDKSKLLLRASAPSVTLSDVRTAVVLYLAGLAVLFVGFSSIFFAGWLAALLVIAGIAIFCAGIAAEERGYKE
jgi:hypothetical protein